MDFRFTDEQNLLRESVARRMEKLATPEYIRALEQAYPYELYDA